MDYVIFQLEADVKTDYSGYNQLTRFYHFCLSYPDKTHFHLDFTEVGWFDGNLSALLLAIIHKLNKTMNHTFSTDESIIKERFDVFFRNGFI